VVQYCLRVTDQQDDFQVILALVKDIVVPLSRNMNEEREHLLGASWKTDLESSLCFSNWVENQLTIERTRQPNWFNDLPRDAGEF